MPQNDYDRIVVTLKNLKDGSSRDITINKGDLLTYTHDGDDMVQVSVKAMKDNKQVSCQAVVFKTVQGVIVADSGPVLVFGNDETYDASQVQVIKKIGGRHVKFIFFRNQWPHGKQLWNQCCG